jgi:hypothetical protein
MFLKIQHYGNLVLLGQNPNMMFGLQPMLVEQQPKDTRVKVVNGENQKIKNNMEHIKLFEDFILILEEEEKKPYTRSHGGLDKWYKEKWVDISKTNPDGTHPPCGRSDTSKGGYPKCRKVRVAAKMTKNQKKASVARKRRVEKKGKHGEHRKPNYSR